MTTNDRDDKMNWTIRVPIDFTELFALNKKQTTT